MLHGENMPPEFARSADWFLSAISIGVGLELIIEYSPFMGDAGISADPGTDAKTVRYRISFRRPAAWAFVDLSLMLQYFPNHDCPPVVQEVDRDADHVYIGEFSIHKEAHGDDWRRFRVAVGDDVIEVISVDHADIDRVQLSRSEKTL